MTTKLRDGSAYQSLNLFLIQSTLIPSWTGRKGIISLNPAGTRKAIIEFSDTADPMLSGTPAKFYFNGVSVKIVDDVSGILDQADFMFRDYHDGKSTDVLVRKSFGAWTNKPDDQVVQDLVLDMFSYLSHWLQNRSGRIPAGAQEIQE